MRVKEHVPLSLLSTMKVGGATRYLVEVEDVLEIGDAMRFCDEKNVPRYIIGGGSNLLFSDGGYHGAVIRITDQSEEWNEKKADAHVQVSAGRSWDDFVAETVHRGYRGLENLSLIPGTVGAAPIQNIGAYGVEVGEIISEVTIFDTTRKEVVILDREACRFSYRHSVFKEQPQLIVLRATFELSKNRAANISYQDLKFWFCERHHMQPSAQEVRDAVINIRQKKFPDLDTYGTLGSFFKNPIIPASVAERLQSKFPDIPVYDAAAGMKKISAAWLIDKIAGYRGIRKGNVGTWPAQALVIVNYGKATTQEISEFADEISYVVKERCGVVLEREVISLTGE